MIDPVIKRDIVGKIIKVSLLLLRRHYRTGHFPNIINALLLVFCHGSGRRIRAQITARRPDHNKLFLFIIGHFDNGQIFRLDTFAFIQHIFQIMVDFFRRNTRQRIGTSIFFLHSYHNISAAPVIYIICKSADCL